MVNQHDRMMARRLAKLSQAVQADGGDLDAVIHAVQAMAEEGMMAPQLLDQLEAMAMSRRRARKVPKRVQARLTARGWEYTVQNQSLLFRLQGVGCICCQINKVIVFQATRVITIRSAAKAEVAALLNDIQRQYLLGTWTIDDDGDVNFAVDLFKEKGGPSIAAIDRCLTVLKECVRDVKPMLRPYQVYPVPDPSEAGATFLYNAGLTEPVPQLFDISDEACEAFGFHHGDRVHDPQDGQTGTTIGVRATPEGRPTLWVHVDGAQGAGVYAPEVFARLKKIGHQVVDPLL